MEYFNFDVLANDGSVVVARSVPLRNSSDAWSSVAEMARDAYVAGSQIRVTNKAGEIVILVGAASTRRLFRASDPSGIGSPN